jgi:hypothetical protein
MPANTQKLIVRARWLQLALRVLTLIGALGGLFCIITMTKMNGGNAWIIRAAPSVAILQTIYAVFHLARAPTSRTPGSTASYMIFAALIDAGIIPFWAFAAWALHLDYTQNAYGWSTLFPSSTTSYTIIYAFFIISCVMIGLFACSLLLDIYLGVKFRQIARLPPDMNPLEPNLTSRHKRNKSSVTATNMSQSALAHKRDAIKQESQAASCKRVPFIHTRTDSADSVTLYGNDSARNSRMELRKGIEETEKDPWRWSRSSSPERPRSAIVPSPTARAAGTGLDFRPERSSMLCEKPEKPSRPASWLSYLDFEGVPSELSDNASAELDHEVRPISPVSAMSDKDAAFERSQRARENWYSGNTAVSVPVYQPPFSNNSQTHLPPHNGSRNALMPPPASPPPKKRSREPLGMNPPTPSRSSLAEQSIHNTPLKQSVSNHNSSPRTVLHDTPANARPTAGSRTSSFVGSGGKSRFYGNLRTSIGASPISSPTRLSFEHDKKETSVTVEEVENLYERTRTMQTESDYSANFEVYGHSSDEDEDDGGKLSANISRFQQTHVQAPPTWNGARQASNSTGFDLHEGYAGLGSEFGKGMGRRRDVSGKVAEEGRASPGRSAGWERFKGL